MPEPSKAPSAEHQQTDELTPTMRPATKPAPGWPGTQFGWRHVKGVALVRALVAVWLVFLGSVFCLSGHWWGVFLFVAAGVVGWLAYQMPRWKLALDAGRNDPYRR